MQYKPGKRKRDKLNQANGGHWHSLGIYTDVTLGVGAFEVRGRVTSMRLRHSADCSKAGKLSWQVPFVLFQYKRIGRYTFGG